MSLNDLQHRKSKPYSKKYHRIMSSVDFLTPFSQKIQEAKNSPMVFLSCNISFLGIFKTIAHHIHLWISKQKPKNWFLKLRWSLRWRQNVIAHKVKTYKYTTVLSNIQPFLKSVYIHSVIITYTYFWIEMKISLFGVYFLLLHVFGGDQNNSAFYNQRIPNF